MVRIVDYRHGSMCATRLERACFKGAVARVKKLLAWGADVTCTNNIRGQSALMIACAFDHAAILRALLAARADVNAADRAGWTPLMFASSEGHDDCGGIE